METMKDLAQQLAKLQLIELALEKAVKSGRVIIERDSKGRTIYKAAKKQ